MRLDDFRSTIKEIVDVNQHGLSPRDKRDLDGQDYGIKSPPTQTSLEIDEAFGRPSSREHSAQRQAAQNSALKEQRTIQIDFGSINMAAFGRDPSAHMQNLNAR